MVAALDRQHPRDFFDIRDLLANEGISEPLRRAFLVYLLSHNRPLFEVLSPRKKSLETEFRRVFLGMTPEPVSLKALTDARETLINLAVRQMPDPHRRFLLFFEQGKPDWNLLALPGATELPAVRWRQENVGKLSSTQRARLVMHWYSDLTVVVCCFCFFSSRPCGLVLSSEFVCVLRIDLGCRVPTFSSILEEPLPDNRQHSVAGK